MLAIYIDGLVFGAHQPVQRCRAHKLRNVPGYLSKEDRPQVKSVLRAAWKLPPKEGMARITKLAAWLDQKYPCAASSLVEGLAECFTINRLDVPPSLCHCLATTNIIESPHAGVRIQTRRATARFFKLRGRLGVQSRHGARLFFRTPSRRHAATLRRSPHSQSRPPSSLGKRRSPLLHHLSSR